MPWTMKVTSKGTRLFASRLQFLGAHAALPIHEQPAPNPERSAPCCNQCAPFNGICLACGCFGHIAVQCDHLAMFVFVS
jgi:hypothetical protein